jgi:DNA-binding transcriptional ArsR family regulator
VITSVGWFSLGCLVGGIRDRSGRVSRLLRRKRKLSRAVGFAGADPTVLRAVALGSRPGWGGIRKSVCFAQVARDLGMSEARVAMTLKQARAAGLVVPTSPRQFQIAYVSTDKLDSLLGL